MSSTAATGASNLTTLCALAQISDKALGDMIGATRQTAYNKRTGRSALDLNDLDLFARVLDVPVTAFLMERDQLLRWVADSGWNGPAGVSSRCTSPIEQPPLPGFEAGAVWCGAGPLLFPFQPPAGVPRPSRVARALELEVQVA